MNSVRSPWAFKKYISFAVDFHDPVTFESFSVEINAIASERETEWKKGRAARKQKHKWASVVDVEAHFCFSLICIIRIQDETDRKHLEYPLRSEYRKFSNETRRTGRTFSIFFVSPWEYAWLAVMSWIKSENEFSEFGYVFCVCVLVNRFAGVAVSLHFSAPKIIWQGSIVVQQLCHICDSCSIFQKLIHCRSDARMV